MAREVNNVLELVALADDLQQENQELKKQLENCYCNRTDCSSRIKDSKQYDSLVQKIENHQKEFIEYLNWQIKNCMDTYKKYGPDNINIDYAAAFEVALDKYKEIIGGKNESI